MQLIYLPQSLDARSSYGVRAFRSHFARPVVFVPRRPRLPLLSVKAAKDPSGPKVAIAGISGAVGQEFIRVGDVVVCQQILASFPSLFSRSSDSTHFSSLRCLPNAIFHTVR